MQRLRQHLSKTLREADTKTAGISALLASRIQLQAEHLDLCALASVKALAKRLVDKGERVDVLVLNAGIGGWRGLDWPRAVWTVLTDWVNATTYPTYKLGYTGNVVGARQIPEGKKEVGGRAEGEGEEPVLGETFTANVFGHYLLAHLLVPVMSVRSGRGAAEDGDEEEQEQGRIIWVSSLEAYEHCFDVDDIQGLNTSSSYESSKRLTDLLVLTSELASTKPFVSSYLSPSNPHLLGTGNQNDTASATAHEQQEKPTPSLPPKLYLAHPGICGTSIANLHPIMDFFMYLAFYISRLLGSPWHTISAYLGACSSVWLALTPLASINRFESSSSSRGAPAESKKGKWGSSADLFGTERVMLTEVEGWGWTGRVGEKSDGKMRLGRGRWKGMKDLTQESREEFEETGRRVWGQMEELRTEWEERLEGL